MLTLGTFLGVKITVKPIAFVGALVLGIALAIVGVALLKLSVLKAIAFGVACVVVHFVSETVHQYGHVIAARRTGYPMLGIKYGMLLIFSTAIYPKDEPKLPRGVHLQRAIGGPLISFAMSLLGIVVVALFASRGGFFAGVAWFMFLENFVLLTLQVFLPLGFNDGSTILYWLRHTE